MEFLLSKEIGHPKVLSRLILKLNEPFEEALIAALITEMEIKRTLQQSERIYQ